MKITLPDASVKEFDHPVSPADVAATIGAGLAKAAIGAKVNDELWDLNRKIEHDCNLAILTRPRVDKDGKTKGEHNPDALYLLRHSTAHVMAEAITRLYPDVKLAYGPPLDNGFYYDIHLDTPISTDDFEKIEAEMAKIIAEDRKFTRYEMNPSQGFKKLQQEENKYKLDNAEKALKNGAKTLSWYITGLPEKTEYKGKNYYAFRNFSGRGKSDITWFPESALNEAVLSDTNCLSENDEKPSGSIVEGHMHWEDLCMGPHIPSTSVIGAFKITSVAASHWHGDITQDRFQRVYGTAFFSKADLDAHMAQLEEAKQRDHRVIGHKLGLFLIDEQVGQGLILWKPRGGMVRNLLQQFLTDELMKLGYDLVYTPHIGKIDLYKTSGHYPYYADAQFPTVKMREQAATVQAGRTDDEEYLLKPMNCPHHIKIFASDPHSYRDLPIRLAEFGTVYRFEQSGELNGLTRVRGFTQDDAHIFCTQDQVKNEFRQTIKLVQFVFDTFGFKDVAIRLSLRDPKSDKYVGTPELWDNAERELREVLNEMGIPYVEAQGEAAFYGPKTDFIVRDVIGRKWQLGTVQLDYNLPERFKLEYIGADNKPHRPVMIHRAPFGSMERFMGILIEHFAGAFPLWIAPEQFRVMPISEKFNTYAQSVYDKLKALGFRVTIDLNNDRVNGKIKVAQELKVPYMLVVGGKDEAAGTVSVRAREAARGDLGAITLDQFITMATQEVTSRGKDLVAKA